MARENHLTRRRGRGCGRWKTVIVGNGAAHEMARRRVISGSNFKQKTLVRLDFGITKHQNRKNGACGAFGNEKTAFSAIIFARRRCDAAFDVNDNFPGAGDDSAIGKSRRVTPASPSATRALSAVKRACRRRGWCQSRTRRVARCAR